MKKDQLALKNKRKCT